MKSLDIKLCLLSENNIKKPYRPYNRRLVGFKYLYVVWF